MKRSTLLVLLFLVISVVITACEKQVLQNPEMINKMLDKNIADTQKSIQDHDSGLARDIWSQISEYGVQAKEIEEKELADELGKLASAYIHLVDYLDTGDEGQLKSFYESYEPAVEALRLYVQNKTKN